MTQAILETERLRLRALTVDDADRVQSIVGDKRISDMVANIPHPYPDDGALTWIKSSQERYEKGENIAYGIVSKENDQVVGAITFKLLPEREAELGYWLGVDFWGKGYCTEAGKTLVAHGFGDLSLKRIQARHLTKNPDSGNVLQKLGMKHYDSREGQCGDKFGSIEFYELAAADYLANQS